MERIQLPLIPLRNIVILPGMLLHFDVSRIAGIRAAEYALKAKQEILLCTQRVSEEDEPDENGLYEYGTVAVVKQIVKLPGNVVRVMVYGARRAKLEYLITKEPFYLCQAEIHTDEKPQLSSTEELAMTGYLNDLLEQYSKENPKLGSEFFKQFSKLEEVLQLVDSIAAQLPMSAKNRQCVLEAVDFIDRYNTVAGIIRDEIEILHIKNDLQKKVQTKVDKNQKEYLMREQMKVIREELGETDIASEADRFHRQCDELEASEEVKETIHKEIRRFSAVSGNSSESAVSRGYIETLLALPWDKKDHEFLNLSKANKILEEEHYGLEKVKDRVMEFLAVRGLTTKGEAPILCLVGPPGTGKTSIARSVARALDKKYVRVCLGGVRDEAEIRGHRRTYVGALPGRLAMGLKSAGIKNPLILLDEIDKVSSDYKGDTASALLEVLDSEQNSKFVDHYVEIPIDLSEVLFIATANSLQTIPRPLLDRMEIIEVNSYTLNDKLHIAKDHLVPKQLKKNGLTAKQLSFTEKALEGVILGYTKEAGVRNLERKIGAVCRKVARELLESDERLEAGQNLTEDEARALLADKKKVSVTPKNLHHYLGKAKYLVEKENLKNEVGLVHGLAWTSVGGDTLQIEVNTMPGKGKFELTGQLGDVMKESAMAGISYIRSVADRYKIEPEYFEKTDIHIHIPEGATPKDGPSAGITMATAMMSAITGKKVRGDIAMTGEITLRGRVLPIGGLTEKLLAAKSVGIKTVLLPEKNKRDVDEISAEILDGMELIYVSDMNEVLKNALV